MSEIQSNLPTRSLSNIPQNQKMNKDKKEILIKLIEKLWNKQPEISFGDLISNLSYLASGHTDINLVKDELLLETLKKLK